MHHYWPMAFGQRLAWPDQFASADFSTCHPGDPWLHCTRPQPVDAARPVRAEELFDQMAVALEAIDMLTDERAATPESAEHGDALTTLLREIFKQKHSDEWLQLLKHDHGLPIERVATF